MQLVYVCQSQMRHPDPSVDPIASCTLNPEQGCEDILKHLTSTVERQAQLDGGRTNVVRGGDAESTDLDVL
jgi:hypothetical protein